MVEIDEKSNAQSWELKVTCKNSKYLNAIIEAILKYGMMDFEVKNIEFFSNPDGHEGRYLITIQCSWFGNLRRISKDLAKIEQHLDSN